jgi:FAD/FMN-containing dehydrogenase
LIAQSEKDAAAFWAVREGHKLMHVMPHLINLDVGLNIGQIGQFVETCRSALQQVFPQIRVLFFGHVGDGNLHIVADQPDIGRVDPTQEVHRIVYDLVRERCGSISAEHGIGTLKRDFLSHSRNPAEIAAMHAIKHALDPEGILNPGKLL